MTGRWICYILAAVLSLVTMAIVLVEALFIFQVRPTLEKNRNVERDFFEYYYSDLQFLNQNPIIPTQRSGSSDAGAFLNSKVHWTPAPQIKARGSVAPLVPVATRENLIRMRDNWMKKHMRAKSLNADLSIFTGLSRFDYWDIENNSPISDLADKRVFVPPAQLPNPEVSDLISLVKFRLMTGAIRGEADLIPALSDVRSFAKLLLTTENQNLIITGLAALDAERFAYRFYVEEKKLAPKSWLPIEKNVLRRATRAVLGTRGYLHLWTHPDLIEKIFLQNNLPPGFCAAVNEGLPFEIGLRPRLEPHWPLEVDLRSEYAKLDAVYRRARSSCRLHYLSELMSHNSIKVSTPGPFILNRLPYSRKVFALRTSIMNFRGFTEYATSVSP